MTATEWVQFGLYTGFVGMGLLISLVCLLRVGRGLWAVLGVIGGLVLAGSQGPSWYANLSLTVLDDPQRAFDVYERISEPGLQIAIGAAGVVGMFLLLLAIHLGRPRKTDRVPDYRPGGRAY